MPPPSSLEDVTNIMDITTPTSSSTRTTRRRYSLLSVCYIFVVPAMAGCLFGYDIGVTSYVVTQLTTRSDGSNNNDNNWNFESNAINNNNDNNAAVVLQGIIVSAASLGALIGSSLMFQYADAIGRKFEMRIGSILYVIGAVLEVLSSFITILPFATLIIGRFTYGIGIGISMHAAPTYLGEMIPPQIRGLFVSLKEVSIVFGILIGYAIGYAFFTVKQGWRYSYACSLPISTCMLLMSFTIPRSCRWLLLKQLQLEEEDASSGEQQQKLEDEARDSLRFVYYDEYVDEEFETMKRAVRECSYGEELEYDDGHGRDRDDHPAAGTRATISPPPPQPPQQQQFELWNNPKYRKPLLAGVGLVVLQQITGQPSVLSYATPILLDAGLADYSSILIAAFKLIATLCAAVTVENFGRKNLLYTGCGLMLVALIALSSSIGTNFYGNKVVVLLSMFTYIGGYQVGFGPCSWLIVSEVFPLAVRGRAVAVAVQMNFLMNFIVQFGVPILESFLGLNVTFCIFAILTTYSISFVKRNVPETKGLTLEEIESQFNDMRDYHHISDDIGVIETERIPLRNN